MKNKINLNIDELTPNLTPGELLVLKCLYEKNKKFLDRINKVYENSVRSAVKTLESKMFIKIQGDTLDDIVFRQKGIDLLTPKKTVDEIEEIINYLNTKLDKKRGFSLKAPGNRRFINGRLQEGYSMSDLKAVIDTKYDDWYGTDYELYLRPETLFNPTKFQTYIGQTGETKSNLIGSINTMI